MAKIVQIRGVPNTVHAELLRQAKAAGRSLNRFLLEEVSRTAKRGHNAEVFRRAANRKGPRLSAEEIVAAIRNARDNPH